MLFRFGSLEFECVEFIDMFNCLLLVFLLCWLSILSSACCYVGFIDLDDSCPEFSWILFTGDCDLAP